MTGDEHLEDGRPCKRVVHTIHAMCELPTPCPLHDAKKIVRLGQFSIMRAVERLLLAILQATIIGWWLK